MKALVVLPPAVEAGSDLPRKIEWVQRRFASAELALAADGGVAERYSRDLDRAILLYTPDGTATDFDVVVLVRGSGDRGCAAAPLSDFTGRLYIQERDGRLALQNQPFDELEVADIDAHAFSRMASRTEAGYYYFPYGYLAHYPGMGPVDSFGFRGHTDWNALRTRDTSHKLVVVSGGSAVWSQCCLPDEAFPAVLERLLNDWSRTSGKGERFSVLNFGLIGNLVLHQLLNYTLFADRLRPEYVIAHDGFNDLVFGLLSDPWLLAEQSIAYQPQFELWGQRLHDTPDELLTQPTQPFEVLSLPHVAVRAYVERKEQFRRLAESGGARFVWGFQPCVFSKGSLSPEERLAVEATDSVHGCAHRKIEFVYDHFLELSHLPGALAFVDGHRAFKAFDRDEHLFHDHVHTTPRGDQKIAALYFDVLRRHLEAGA